MLEFIFISVVVFALISIVQKSKGLFIKSIPLIIFIQIVLILLYDESLFLKIAVFLVLLVISAMIILLKGKQLKKENA